MPQWVGGILEAVTVGGGIGKNGCLQGALASFRALLWEDFEFVGGPARCSGRV